MLQMGGTVQELIDQKRSQLETVQYSSRWACAAYFGPAAWEAVLAASGAPPGGPSPPSSSDSCPAAPEGRGWVSKYVEGDDVLRYVSLEQLKNGKDVRKGEEGPAVLLHTSVPFGLNTVDKAFPDDWPEIEAVILSALDRVIPGLPAPLQTKLLKWRYSQVYKGYKGDDGGVLLGGQMKNGVFSFPPLILAGDAFSESTFEGCYASAYKASQLVTEALQKHI
mmetsp:Transcript_22585/g.32778  ORF Transcript_22585/g.32778 Transcript_22585/m.32778 type:complete len:222 (-) Transcript_22585:193-858(-)